MAGSPDGRGQHRSFRGRVRTATVLELDGADGGGQLVRTALSLAAVTGEPFRMENVRGGRSEPGLRPQHLAAVSAVATACDATVEGDEQGSETLVVEPGDLAGGTVAVDVGTAGSLTLVFDALLPLATALDEPLAVAATGGTDVKWSPPTDYYRRVKLPLLRERGFAAAVDLDRRGFYPAGGGAATLHLYPSSPPPLSLPDRGGPTGWRVHSVASADLADASVAERQVEGATERLVGDGEEADRPSDPDSSSDHGSPSDSDSPSDDGPPVVERSATYAETDSTGTAVVVRADCGATAAGFDALGEPGRPAEDVGRAAADAALAFAAGGAAVDRHMADQVVVLLALCGGRVRIPAVTDHVETNRELVGAFGFDVRVEETDDGPVLAADRPATADAPERD